MDELKLQTLSSLRWASLGSQFSSLILNWQLEVYPVHMGFWDQLEIGALPLWAGFPGGSEGKESACNAGDLGLIPGSGSFPGGGHGNPL